ncbi:hypothetical protein ACU61A_32110 [Pseudonocardia sichuanensis]|uniref:DUF308 domain-containing protein n=1 Tax=Pseudonocardia kunmingensis TaxID=630975 RepID=A0A543DXQ7_9PSEU|nr:hypothetical protein [Pseudonocardia kunmingensis]TQM14113.1 hypothetical protein FB558_0871 [Pseudonocardia kunmingensis]
MNRDPDERAQPDGAAPDEFEAIVAGWRREGEVPEWPADVDPPAGLFESPQAPPPPRSPDPAPPTAPVPLPEDEHFVPPEPPPLPRLGPPALVGLTLLALGLVLVVSPGLLGVSEPYGLPLGLVGLAAGLGWLVLRLWPDPPDRDDEDDDDGAVL